MKQEMTFVFKCLWCSRETLVKGGQIVNPCECFKEGSMEDKMNKLEKQVQSMDGDLYLMNKTLETMDQNIKELISKYELLLNRIKCIECKKCETKE